LDRGRSAPLAPQFGCQLPEPSQHAGSTAQAGGVVSLVTPVRIHSGLPGFADIPAFGYLQIEFVPEPSVAVLVGAGLAALAADRRRRAQSR
jgi:hypothetical protein